MICISAYFLYYFNAENNTENVCFVVVVFFCLFVFVFVCLFVCFLIMDSYR